MFLVQITATTVPKESAVMEKMKRRFSIIKECANILIQGMNRLDRERDLKPKLMLNG